MQREDFRLLSLKIENFRCYDNFEIDFDTNAQRDVMKTDADMISDITVLVANNGSGKTAILDAINIAWGSFIGKMPVSYGAWFRFDDICRIKNTTELKSNISHPSITAVFQVNGDRLTVTRTLSDLENDPPVWPRESNGLVAYADRILKYCKDDPVCVALPMVAYYGEHRTWNAYGYTSNDMTFIQSRKYAHLNSTDTESGYDEFIAWYKHLQMVVMYVEAPSTIPAEQKPFVLAEVQREYESCKHYSAVLDRAVETVLGEYGWNRLCYRFSEERMYVQNVHKEEILDELPIECLGGGAKSILGIVADLVSRCCRLNPILDGAPNEVTPGVVLIDAIDSHLHPKWQQVVVRDLRRVFPQIQFIVTTQSPYVVSSVTKNCVRIISEGGVVEYPESQTQGVTANDILCGVFWTLPSPQYLSSAKKIDRLNALIAAGLAKSEEFNAICEELTTQYGAEYGPLLDVLCFAELQQYLNAN